MDEQPPRDNNDRVARARERNVAIIARRLELEEVREQAWSRRMRDHVALQPPAGWRHPVTGRRELTADPLLVDLGRYLRRGRAFAGFSQQGLGYRADVTQSMISRAERGLAPSMGVDRLAQLGRVLGRAFPLGCCPHEHDCAWQPIIPRQHKPTETERLVELMLGRRSDGG